MELLSAPDKDSEGMSYQKPDYRRAEQKALEFLKKAGVVEPPVNPVQLAEMAGVKVSFVTFSPDESEKVSGFYDCEENAILVNSEESPLRQTFTVAHELGHKILHEEWAKSADYKVLLRNPEKSDQQDPREQEANAFAANLLMPRFLMDRYYSLPVPQLSQLFAVSVPAIKARLSFLYGI
jgi:Zn-dependent peptidase ImmA (M78 family)